MYRVVNCHWVMSGVKHVGKMPLNSASRRTIPVKTAQNSAHVAMLLSHLNRLYPAAECELNWRTPLELLVAVILSAQCTDKRVNLVTGPLFARFADAQAFAQGDVLEIEQLIHSTGFYRMKAKHIQAACQIIVRDHGGEVPRTMASLLKLPGVARKTANVVLGVAFDHREGFVVDTHVKRLAQRLGLSSAQTPEKIEQDLMACVPQKEWLHLSHLLIWHGRRLCMARNPKCEACPLAPLCPSARI